MKKICMFCKKEISENLISNKVGNFCSNEHYDKYLKSLSDEEYIKIQHSFCICSDDEN